VRDSGPVKRIVMLGPPASGKGTQGERLAEHLGVPHVSTGELLRESIERGDPLGVKDTVGRGERVPDDVIEELLRPALADGFVLDGYPRSPRQAERLDRLLDDRGVDAVVELEVDDTTLAARMGLRAKEEHRADDRPEVFVRRLEAYRRDTPPIREHYAERLRRIDGHGDEDEIFQRILSALES
jgi:adenylate kinase